MKKKNIFRNPRSQINKTLIPHLYKIFSWARVEKLGSKRNISKLMLLHFQIEVSPDQIYHFVKKMNGGVWPNSRPKKVKIDD